MTRRKWAFAGGVLAAGAATRLLMAVSERSGMRMTAVEKSFVNSDGHRLRVAGHAESLLDEIRVEPGWRYLDVGCGVGAAARRIAETRPLEVVGVDLDPGQIRVARSSGAVPNLKFQVMDATQLEFSDQEFDIVATSKTTHHIPCFERALAEMTRVLRPGGYLICTDFTVPGWLAAVGKRALPIMGFPSESALTMFASEAGLNEVYRTRQLMRLDTIWRKQ